MSLYSLFHTVFGEYIFETDSSSFPAIANALSKKKIGFWRIETVEDRVRFRCSLFLSEEIIISAEELGLGIEIVKKRGFPFFFSRYRKRYGLILGALLGLFLLFYSQLFVWKINIEGNTSLSEHDIETALSDCGISVGSYIPEIDVKYYANRLILNREEISSAAISINGTHLTVNILETTFPPRMIDGKGFFNVIAERDGVILDIDAADGSPEVSEGDAVYKGELLINSFIEGNNGAYRPTHARGIVYAAVEESLVSEIPLSRITRHYTGKTATRFEITVLGKKVPSVVSTSSPYEYFDAISTESTLVFLGIIEFPIKVFKAVYCEYSPETETITPEYAKRLAEDDIDGRLRDMKCEIISCDKKLELDEKNGVCRLTANAVVKQNIAKEVPFEIDYYNISERLPNASE